MLPTAIVRAVKPRSASAEHDIERDAVAAHDHEIGHRGRLPISVTRRGVPASSASASASISRKPSAWEKLVTDPSPWRSGKRPALLAGDQRDQHELLAAELGGNAHRNIDLDAARGFGRKTGAGTDHRRDESVKGENRGGGKARQHSDGLASDDGEAERLSRLERDAMDENVAQFRDDAVGEIAPHPSTCRRRVRPCRKPRAPRACHARAPSHRRGKRRREPAPHPLPRSRLR
jgi:hypothetical protein